MLGGTLTKLLQSLAARGWFIRRRLDHRVYLASVLILAGCAANVSAPEDRAPADPWEPMNRSVYEVNDALDRSVLKPVAKGYRKVLPTFVRTGIGNFYDNLLTPGVMLNNFLQGKGQDGLSDLARLAINSTIGIGGLIDIASRMGIAEHDEDFGQTLATWGVGAGPYVTLPFFGPSTLRDALTMPVDFFFDPLLHYRNSSVRDKLWVIEAIDLRSSLLAAEGLLEKSFDPYITLRQSYLQNRRFEIYDGNPPEEDDFYDDFLDEEFEE